MKDSEIYMELLDKAVRPLVTFGLAGGLLFGFISEKIPADAYLTATSLVLGFWFRDRNEMKKTEETIRLAARATHQEIRKEEKADVVAAEEKAEEKKK